MNNSYNHQGVHNKSNSPSLDVSDSVREEQLSFNRFVETPNKENNNNNNRY